MEAKITKVRLNHVSYYIGKREEFAAKVAEKGWRNYEKGDEIVPFPVVVWDICEALFKNGIDPSTLKGKEVVKWAEFLVLGGPSPTAHAVTAEPSKPVEKVPEGVVPDTAPRGTGLEKMPVRFAIATLLFTALDTARFDKSSTSESDAALLAKVAELYHPSPKSQTGNVNA